MLSREPENNNQHQIVFGGGAAYVLGHVGAYLALLIANLADFDTIGGASAGSIFGLTAAAKLSPHEMVQLFTGCRFADIFKRAHSHEGLLSTAPLGRLIEEQVPTWPGGYWTCAATDRASTVCFTADGVYEQPWISGCWQTLLDQPVSTQFAVQASCTIPGAIAPLQFMGRKLFDGGVTPYGICPVGLVTELYGTEPKNIVAVDVCQMNRAVFEAFAQVRKHWLLGSSEIPIAPNSTAGITLRPDLGRMDRAGIWIPRIGHLSVTVPCLGFVRFNMGVDHKQAVVLDAFRSIVMQLGESGRIDGKVQKHLFAAGRSFTTMLAAAEESAR